MEKYKIKRIIIDNDTFLSVETVKGKYISTRIPVSCTSFLKPGMTLKFHRMRNGEVGAYSADGYLVFAKMPITRESIAGFIASFKDIYNFSLDSIIFKYELRKAVHKMGLSVSRSSVVNLMMYNYNMIDRSR